MFTPNNRRLVLIAGCLAVGLLIGCAQPPEPCTVDASAVKAAQDGVKKAKRDLDASKAEVQDLEAEYKAKQAEADRLQAKKVELDKLKSKVEGGGPPRR